MRLPAEILEGLPDWPALMGVEVAAAYCNMSVDSFERCVEAGRVPAAVTDLPVRRKMWQRAALDAAINRRVGGEHDRQARKAEWRRRHQDRSPDAG